MKQKEMGLQRLITEGQQFQAERHREIIEEMREERKRGDAYLKLMIENMQVRKIWGSNYDDSKACQSQL